MFYMVYIVSLSFFVKVDTIHAYTQYFHLFFARNHTNKENRFNSDAGEEWGTTRRRSPAIPTSGRSCLALIPSDRLFATYSSTRSNVWWPMCDISCHVSLFIAFSIGFNMSIVPAAHEDSFSYLASILSQ